MLQHCRNRIFVHIPIIINGTKIYCPFYEALPYAPKVAPRLHPHFASHVQMLGMNKEAEEQYEEDNESELGLTMVPIDMGTFLIKWNRYKMQEFYLKGDILKEVKEKVRGYDKRI